MSEVAVLPELPEHQRQVDKVAVFVNRQRLLLSSTLWPAEREAAMKELEYRFPDRVHVVDMPEHLYAC